MPGAVRYGIVWCELVRLRSDGNAQSIALVQTVARLPDRARSTPHPASLERRRPALLTTRTSSLTWCRQTHPSCWTPDFLSAAASMQRSTSVLPLGDHPVKHRQRIFGDKLTQLCSLTEANLQRLELQVAADECQRQLAELVSKTEVSSGSASSSNRYETGQSKGGKPWQNLDTIFTGNVAFGYTEKRKVQPQAAANDDSNVCDTDAPSMNSYCYLCTTQEEHRSHLKSAKKVHGKPRRTYNVPATALPHPRPLSATKLSADTSGRGQQQHAVRSSAGVLYKVTVFTGSFGMSEPVSLQIVGSEGRSDVTELARKARPVTIFLPNAKETFTVRTDTDLGHLKKIKLFTRKYDVDHNVEAHRGSTSESVSGWTLNEIRIVKFRGLTGRKDQKDHKGAAYSAGVYTFSAGRRLFTDPGTNVETLTGELLPEEAKEYDVSIVTGKLSGFSSPDARVYATLIGSRGRSDKLELKDMAVAAARKGSFERGSTKTFRVASTTDVGTITKLRIEHEGDLKVRWHLMLVLVRDVNTGRGTLFKCNQLLAEEEGNARWRELLGQTLSVGSDTALEKYMPKGLDTLYELEVRTGTVPYAGTNANVTVQLVDQNGKKTRPIGLPHSSLNHANAFESGQTDVFRVTAADVGEIHKLAIGHDNTGLSPGWFLEQVIVRKFSNVPATKKKRMKSDAAAIRSREHELANVSLTDGGDSRPLRDPLKSGGKDRRETRGRTSPKKRQDGFSSRSENSDDEEEQDEEEDEEETVEELGTDARAASPGGRTARTPTRLRRGYQQSSQWRSSFPDDTVLSGDSEGQSNEDISKADARKTDCDMDRALANKRRLERMYKSARRARPRIDEYTFIVRRWLAIDEGDRQIHIELRPSSQRAFETSI